VLHIACPASRVLGSTSLSVQPALGPPTRKTLCAAA
jgi:hypothetical protein